MARPDVPPMQDGHLPPLGEGSVADLRAAIGIRHKANSRTRSERRMTTLTARELRAIELTAAGATYDQVGVILSINRTSARQLVERALARRALEVQHRELGPAKALQLERLEFMMRRWWPLAVGNPREGTAPNDRAAAIVLSIMDRQERLLGLAAPIRIEEDIKVSLSYEELEER
ncbi:MAG TPA: hypothetical protein VF454_04940, partial [Gemmatimonadales bacterium]